jgi:hypothetical protein
MTETIDTTFDNLVAEHFGARLPQQLTAGISWTALHSDARQFILRMFSLMKGARYRVTDFTPYLVRVIFTMVPSVLPFAWGGRIPPLTIPNRHHKLDVYVEQLYGNQEKDPAVFVDLGCGFPPVTTVETADYFKGWQIYCVDRFFAEYVLYDAEGHYACFDGEGFFQYFQPQMIPSGRAMYENPAATRTYFQNLFATMAPMIDSVTAKKSQTVEANGNRLVHNLIRTFESEKLHFIESELQVLDLPPASVIRCMNMLLYFPAAIRKKMLRQAGRTLADDGIIIAGTNGFGIDGRYTVYRKDGEGVRADEFAFGMENLRTFWVMPWFTIHENDPEAGLLSRLMGVIRSDSSYWPRFTKRVDALLDRYQICRRENDGYLHFATVETPGPVLLSKLAGVWRQIKAEGYLTGAVEALSRAGYSAWENRIGDIAVRPPTDALP